MLSLCEESHLDPLMSWGYRSMGKPGLSERTQDFSYYRASGKEDKAGQHTGCCPIRKLKGECSVIHLGALAVPASLETSKVLQYTPTVTFCFRVCDPVAGGTQAIRINTSSRLGVFDHG